MAVPSFREIASKMGISTGSHPQIYEYKYDDITVLPMVMQIRSPIKQNNLNYFTFDVIVNQELTKS